MPNLTVLSVIGTRPEAIKMAPVVQELARHTGRVRSVICSTGQHRQMLDQVFALFRLAPDVDLNLMQANQTLPSLTARLIERLDSVYQEYKPDWVLAQGDTTTVLAAALVAFYHKIKFGHVEAGLRTGDKSQPFPEEMNRCLADRLADRFFTPTERARQALLREGAPERDVLVTGNTVIDALLAVAEMPYDWASGPLAALPAGGRFVLVTAHRRESFGGPFREMCEALRRLAADHREIHFVYPVHLNPNVRGPVGEVLSGLPNMHLLEPIDYFSLVHLMKRSVIVLTDSGGIQEEAPSLGVPVLVMRETTERPEGVDAGVSRLVGTRGDRIVAEASNLLANPAARAAMGRKSNPYGDGHAAKRIVASLLERP